MLSNLPNILTILRLLAVFPLVYWLLTGAYQPALILAFIAGISDWVDGVLARRFGWTSRFGGIMDPLADKLMLVSLTLVLAYIGEFPVWLALLIIIRDVVIVAGGVTYKYFFGSVDVQPFRLSKWNTGLVILLVLVVILRLNNIQFEVAGLAIMPLLEDGLILVTALTTIISGIQYVWVWGVKAIGLHQSAKIKTDDSV
ncbi:MAG: CDP-alcohol phosphatidyltransferase family protein [Xanthomonadales bacterium]|nr:CDP-alcohol phosphatidyltransferase family protein [Xanthomonadales bacterium]